MGLELKDISISVEGRVLFEKLSCDVKSGECLTIMGASGVGKSTLLDYISRGLGEEFEASGQVLIDGEAVEALPSNKRRIGILYQEDLLFPHMTVGENLAFGLSQEITGPDRKTRIAQALKDADLEGFEDRDPVTLSGGQRARVSCMRMLLSHPKVLLLDEPFSKLDPDLRDRFRRFVFSRVREEKLPVILVTHDQEDAAAAGGATIDLGK